MIKEEKTFRIGKLIKEKEKKNNLYSKNILNSKVNGQEKFIELRFFSFSKKLRLNKLKVVKIRGDAWILIMIILYYDGQCLTHRDLSESSSCYKKRM